MAADIDALTGHLVDEIFIALGLGRESAARRLLGRVVDRPARRFATLAAELDRRVSTEGPRAGARWLLSHFVDRVDVEGAEGLPASGPLLVAANHPGAYDSVALIASMPRDDIRLISSDVALFRLLPAVSTYLLQTDRDPYRRLAAVRAGMRHLAAGGALLSFAAGMLDPDPALFPDAPEALEAWSPSLGLFLRGAPEARAAVAISGGVVAARWMRHPLVALRRRPHDRRKLAEFLQVISQLLAPGRLHLAPRLTFGRALVPTEMAPDPRAALVAEARRVMTATYGVR